MKFDKIWPTRINACLARRVKIFKFQVVAETVENQTHKTFGDAGGEDYESELSGRIGWFSEFVNGNDRTACKKIVTSLKRKRSYCWLKEYDAIWSLWKNEAGFHIWECSLFMNLHSRTWEEWNWEPENSGLWKETFFQAVEFKRWLKTVQWLKQDEILL